MVRLLYKSHERGRPRPFNVFEAIRKREDEVNLHSRFLVAVLSQRGAPERCVAVQPNLKDFVSAIVGECWNTDGAVVERERHNIDILITKDTEWAIVIENKIWAPDGPRQLWRYFSTACDLGFPKERIRLFYLTPDGRDPSKQSVSEPAGKNGREVKVTPISYKEHITPWLDRCQQRAYNNAPLRDSIAQYMDVVRSLTGTSIGAKYMNTLKELLLDGDNLAIASELEEPIRQAKTECVRRLWEAIEGEIEPRLAEWGLGLTEPPSNISDDRIQAALGIHHKQRNKPDWQHGLYYALEPEPGDDAPGPSLGVEMNGQEFWYGVRCNKDQRPELYDAIGRALGPCTDVNDWWPYARFPEALKGFSPRDVRELSKLTDPKVVEACASQVAEGLDCIYQKLRDQAVSDETLAFVGLRVGE